MTADMFGRTEEEKAAAAADRDKVLSVPCPGCEVEAGQRCVNTITGTPTNIAHAVRATAWDKAKKKAQSD
jgi:hypothetical protein